MDESVPAEAHAYLPRKACKKRSSSGVSGCYAAVASPWWRIAEDTPRIGRPWLPESLPGTMGERQSFAKGTSHAVICINGAVVSVMTSMTYGRFRTSSLLLGSGSRELGQTTYTVGALYHRRIGGSEAPNQSQGYTDSQT